MKYIKLFEDFDVNKLINRATNFEKKRYDINNIPNNIILLVLTYKNAGKFFLYDINKKKVVGFIVFDIFVDRVYTEYKGFGTFLYESAMTYLYPNGLSMSREGSTSEDSLRVWDKFNHRNDVKKERMYSDELTYKKETLPNLQKYKDDPDKLNYILTMEDTKFFYNYGKEKLNNLIEIGEKYMKQHGISKNDLDSMEIDINFQVD